MTDYQNTAAGTTSGVAVTTANSGGTGGDPFASVQATNAAITFDNTHPLHGFNALKIAGNGASGVGYVSYSTLNGNSVRAEAYLYLTALPVSEQTVIWLSSATTVQASVGLLSSGKMVQRASGTAGTGNSGTAVIPLNTWVRFELGATINATTGTLQSAMYNGESTTPLDSLSTTGQNTGSAAIVNARFGNTSTSTNTSAYWLGNPRVGDTSSSFYGPYVAPTNTLPTITGPGTINITGSTTSLTFQGSDTDGTISSFACVNQSNTAVTTITPTIGTGVVTGAGTANASVTFPISGLTANAKYFFGGTATDNAGGTSTTSVATVSVVSNTPIYRSVTAVGHTVVGGGTALAALQAATPSSRYLESPAPPGGASDTITYQPLQPSTAAKAFSVTARAKNADSTIAITVTLKMNDTTTIATRGPFNLTLTDAAYGGTTTTSETALITDSSKLSTSWSEV